MEFFKARIDNRYIITKNVFITRADDARLKIDHSAVTIFIFALWHFVHNAAGASEDCNAQWSLHSNQYSHSAFFQLPRQRNHEPSSKFSCFFCTLFCQVSIYRAHSICRRMFSHWKLFRNCAYCSETIFLVTVANFVSVNGTVGKNSISSQHAKVEVSFE